LSSAVNKMQHLVSWHTVLWCLLVNRSCRPYNLYCVGSDVKLCSINQCW